MDTTVKMYRFNRQEQGWTPMNFMRCKDYIKSKGGYEYHAINKKIPDSPKERTKINKIAYPSAPAN